LARASTDGCSGGVATTNTKEWPTTAAASTNSSADGYVNPSIPGQLTPQPKTAAGVLNRVALGLLNPGSPVSGIDVFMNAQLQTFSGSLHPAVVMASSANNAKILSIKTAVGVISGKVFIDASYEGDIMSAVANQTGGTSYSIGRESSSALGEAHNGSSPSAAAQLGGGVSLVDGSGNPLFPLINNPNGTAGQADAYIQPYNFRATIQKVADGGVAFTRPADYDATKYTLIGRVLTGNSGTTITSAVTLNRLEGTNKYCLNDVSGGVPFNMTNEVNGYPDGTPSQRSVIFNSVKSYFEGLLYYLQTDSGVPAAVRTDTAAYGLAGDEFPDNGNWPYQMYIREGRRMTGAAKVMTEADVTNPATQTHPIGRTSYVLDCHTPLAYVTDGTHYVQDGAFFITSGFGTNCQIPMEALYPSSGGCPNLIVSVCVGATHVAWMPLRMEPTFAIMGEAAGLMAYRV
jgi:FAD dependent oxidoreductase